jgi:uncharacterized protein YggL (DUF469 family)
MYEGKRDKNKKNNRKKMALYEFQEALKYPKLHRKHTLRTLGSYNLLQ